MSLPEGRFSRRMERTRHDGFDAADRCCNHNKTAKLVNHLLEQHILTRCHDLLCMQLRRVCLL